MKLADLRRFTVRGQYRVRFRLGNGMECVVTEHGIAQVPDLKGVSDLNLEQELASVDEFVLEPAERKDQKSAPKPRSMKRQELAALAALPAAAPGHEEE